MKEKKQNRTEDPEARRGTSAGRRASTTGRQRGFVERATAHGHSGHGAESVRPHLRDQLRLKALLPQPFPMPEVQQRAKDEHHR